MAFKHIDVALSGALYLFEISKHEGLNGFKGVLLICHGMLQEMIMITILGVKFRSVR